MAKNKKLVTSDWTPEKRLDKQLLYYLLFTFLISWPPMIWSSISHLNAKAFVPVMVAPFIALLIAGRLTHHTKTGRKWDLEGSGILWDPQVIKNKKWYLWAWLVPIAFCLGGALLYFLIFPGNFSLDIMGIYAKVKKMSLGTFILQDTLITLTLSVIAGVMPVMAEELGWRGYMMPRLTEKFGVIKALFLGAGICSVWEWPMLLIQWHAVPTFVKSFSGQNMKTFSGYLYGVEYPGAPWTGLIAMTIYAFALSVVLWWLYCKTKSIWPSVLAHGAFSTVGMHALSFRNVLTVKNWLLGPSLPGLIGVIPLLSFAIYLVVKRRDEMDMSLNILECPIEVTEEA